MPTCALSAPVVPSSWSSLPSTPVRLVKSHSSFQSRQGCCHFCGTLSNTPRHERALLPLVSKSPWAHRHHNPSVMRDAVLKLYELLWGLQFAFESTALASGGPIAPLEDVETTHQPPHLLIGRPMKIKYVNLGLALTPHSGWRARALTQFQKPILVLPLAANEFLL